MRNLFNLKTWHNRHILLCHSHSHHSWKNKPDFIGFVFFSGALRGDAVPPAAWTPSGWRCVYASKLAHFAITQTLFATTPPSSPPLTKKTNPITVGFFFFSGALHGDAVPPAAWTPSGWRCVYASKLAHFAITQTLFATSHLISTTTEKTNPITVGFFFCFISGTGVIVEREREGKTLKRCCPLGKTIAIVRCCFCLSLYATQYATVYFPIPSVLFDWIISDKYEMPFYVKV